MENVIITKLTQARAEDMGAINRLLPQLSEKLKLLSLADFKAIVGQNHLYVFVARDREEIIGMAILSLTRLASGARAAIDDVVVDEAYRGQGIGTMLMEALIDAAKQKGAAYIDLTSRPERKAANELYQKLGFQRRESAVYRFIIAK